MDKRKMIKDLLYYALVIALLTSCSAKRISVEKVYEKQIDTFISYKDKIIYKEVKDTLVVDSPCDSLGNLKDFERSVVSPQGKVVIKSVDGNIQAEVKIDKKEDIKEHSYRSTDTNKELVEKEEIVKYKTPLWLIMYALSVTVLCLFLLKSKLAGILKIFS